MACLQRQSSNTQNNALFRRHEKRPDEFSARSALFRWRDGRQGSGYQKLYLGGLGWPVKFDSYLLRFNVGSSVPKHIDPVKKGRHFRLNIVLMNAKSGGEFFCDSPLFESKRIKLFRPDIAEHSVSEIRAGVRLVFSLGWIYGNNEP